MRALNDSLARAHQALAAAYDAGGSYPGELSSSALSTATAAMALTLSVRSAGEGAEVSERAGLAAAGLAWLCAHQNEDGGWGDTTESPSNISTTTLCWASLGAAASARSATPDATQAPAAGGPAAESSAEASPSEASPAAADSEAGQKPAAAAAPIESAGSASDAAIPRAVQRAEAWLRIACGGTLEPAMLAQAIRARYGADHTFSVPILTMCALAGRLGEDGWGLVPQLPFELAAFPRRLFRVLSLRVVSYALPALIAIGQVRHAKKPTRNPVTRLARQLSRRRTLRILRDIQPASGGYLEAAPLTSFVAMSLIAAGESAHPVVRDGLAFLSATVRGDGSWPIDTNLDTWCTTLAVGAVPAGRASSGEVEDRAASPSFRRPEAERAALAEWLLGQQLQAEHPYTLADPGGFAWTDRPGGVPDADDTAGAVLALRQLSTENEASRFRDAAARGIVWLLDLQNRDGGTPTFCRGWGKLPFDRSGADLTAHALRAYAAWQDVLPAALATRVRNATPRAVDHLLGAQRADGAWVPLWFGNQHEVGQENPIYGTSRVLRAVSAQVLPRGDRAWVAAAERGILYLLGVQGQAGGFGAVPSVEETALAVESLAEWMVVGRTAGGRLRVGADPGARELVPEPEVILDAVRRGAAWLAEATGGGREFPTAPIGLYFAKLWYHERLYPLVFTVSALEWASRCLQAAGDDDE